MDEYARLNISDRVDMAIASASGYAAMNEFTVVLEVDSKDFLAACPVSDFSYSVVHIFTLFRVKKKFC